MSSESTTVPVNVGSRGKRNGGVGRPAGSWLLVGDGTIPPSDGWAVSVGVSEGPTDGVPPSLFVGTADGDWVAVGVAAGVGVMVGVGGAVGTAVGGGSGAGVGGGGVGFGVGFAVGLGVGRTVGTGVGAEMTTRAGLTADRVTDFMPLVAEKE